MAEDWRALLAAADRARPGLARLVERAVLAARSPDVLRAVTAALRRGDYGAAERVAVEAARGALGAVEAQLARDLHAVLGQGALAVPDVRLVARFDVLNPRAVEWARTRSATLVRAITDGQRGALRELTRRMVGGELTVDAGARLVRGVIGLDARRAGALAAFAERTRAALGPRVRESGRARAERRIDRYAARLLRQRAATIAHTEALAAANQGQLEAWRQAQAQGLLRGVEAVKVWVVTPDDQLCAWCAPLAESERRMGEPFAAGHWAVQAPPLHPNCRCTLVLRTRPLTGALAPPPAPPPPPPPSPPPVAAPALLSAEERRELVQSYVAGSEGVNDALRSGRALSPYDARVVRALDEVIAAAPPSDARLLYRWVDRETLRGIGLREVGDAYSDAAFVSTSRSLRGAQAVAEGFADAGIDPADMVLMRVRVPAGARGVHMPSFLPPGSYFAEQDEFLLARGQLWRLSGRRPDGSLDLVADLR